MAAILLTLVLGVSDGPVVDLAVNRSTVLVGDFVIVKSIVSNRGPVGVYIENRLNNPAIQFEINRGKEWRPLLGMTYRKSHGVPGEAPLLDVDAKYAEYNLIFFDDQDRFVFDRPGRYELRAEVRLSDKQYRSKPVAITVKPRAPSLIKQLRETGISVASLGGPRSHNVPLAQNLIALENVGGTIGDAVQHQRLMERIISGEERIGDDAIKYIRDHMPPLDAEIGLLMLGEHYFRTRRDWLALARVAEEFPENSWMKASWQASLDFHLKRLPMIVVPGDKPPSR